MSLPDDFPMDGAERVRRPPRAGKLPPSRLGSGPSRPLVQAIQHKLGADEERERQRRKLVNILIIAQLLLTLAVALGYVVPQVQITLLPLLVLALGIYAAAFLTNLLLHNGTLATYILVFGGGLVVTGQVAVAAMASDPTETSHAALFFVIIVLEAGLLFAPEVTLITATAATTFTAALLLLALSSAPFTPQAYLLVVYTLSLQALTGLIAWLLAHFIYESSVAQQRAYETEFSQARLDALQGQLDAQQIRLTQGIGNIQMTITQVIRGEAAARVDPLDGELATLAQSMNMLLESVEPALRAQEERAYLEEWARHLVENAGKLSEGMTPDPDSMPVMGNAMDSLSVVVSYMQTSNQRRLARLQKLAADIGSLTTQGRGVLSGANEQAGEAHRITGAVVSILDTIVTRTRQRIDTLERLRRMLSAVLPAEITNMPAGEARPEGLDATDAARLQELDLHIGIERTGHTNEFPIVSSNGGDASAGGDIPPLTRPLEAVSSPEEDAGEAKSASRRKGSATAGQLPTELVEVWNLLVQFANEVEQDERTLAQLLRDLGIASRGVRHVEGDITWALQAFDTIGSYAEQMHQAGGSHVPPLEPIDPASSAVMSESTSSMPLPRLTSHPLAPDDPTNPPAGAGNGEGPTPPGSIRLSDLIEPEMHEPQPGSDEGDAPHATQP
jgi:hypothetical protein